MTLLALFCVLDLVTTTGAAIYCMPPSDLNDPVEIPDSPPNASDECAKYTQDVTPDNGIDDEKDLEEFIKALENMEKFDPLKHESYLCR